MQTQSSHQKPLGASPVVRLLCLGVIKLVPSLIVTPRPRSLEKQGDNRHAGPHSNILPWGPANNYYEVGDLINRLLVYKVVITLYENYTN